MKFRSNSEQIFYDLLKEWFPKETIAYENVQWKVWSSQFKKPKTDLPLYVIKYTPDFYIKNTYIEVKGWSKQQDLYGMRKKHIIEYTTINNINWIEVRLRNGKWYKKTLRNSRFIPKNILNKEDII